MPTARSRRTATSLVALLGGGPALAGCTPAVVDGTIEPFTTGGGEVVSRQQCAGGEFECVTLTLPSDHLAAASRLGGHLRRPPGRRRAARGPGDGDRRPGIQRDHAGRELHRGAAPEITDSYDLVFFDQRGIGRSEPFRCDDAAADFTDVVDVSAGIEPDGRAWTPEVPVDGRVEVTDGGMGDATMTVTLPFAALEMLAGGRVTGTFRGDEVD